MSIAQKTQPEYTLKTASTWSAHYHGSDELRTAVLVLVENLTKGVTYSVLVPTDGAPCTCTCKSYEYRHSCRHISAALGHLLKEAGMETCRRCEAPTAEEETCGGACPACVEVEIESAGDRHAQALADRPLWD